MLKVIVLDDEIKIRNGITNLINGLEGFKVLETFERAIEAIEYIENNCVDIIVTDIKMPEISGLEFIERILDTSNEVYTIILSGYSDFNYAKKAIELGIYRYLTKPTDIKELINTLEGIKREVEKEESKEVDNLIISKVILYIEENYSNKITLQSIADKVFISPSYLSRLFKKHMGINLNEYILEYRMEKAKNYLKQARYNINEVANLVGYKDTKYFSSSFKKIIGLTPIEYRNKI